MSDVIASIEAEAERMVEEARRRAQSIVEEARAEAERILSDESYKAQLEELRRSLEERLKMEVQEIIARAEDEARRLSSIPDEVLVRLAKRIASRIAGVQVE